MDAILQRGEGEGGGEGKGERVTIVEIIVTVIIIAILVGVAVPIYGKLVRNARLIEEATRLDEIVAGAKAYAEENRDALGNPVWPAGPFGSFDLRPSRMFTYAITEGAGEDAGATPLTVTATGLAGTRMAGTEVSVSAASIRSGCDAPIIVGN
jgi:Tfp pilus assembly protein PilE